MAEHLATRRRACLSSHIQCEGYLEADPERVQQAVLILVGNAARHSPPGSCVSLTTRISGGHFAVTAQDTGPGISAADRARTIQVATAADAKPGDLVTPGHVFPLRARRGGVLVRTGQTEGSVDLARLAGLRPSGVICEIMNDDGTMARMPDLERFSQEHTPEILSVADLIQYRLLTVGLVRRIAGLHVMPIE